MPWKKGQKQSIESNLKRSLALQGIRRGSFSKEHRKKLSEIKKIAYSNKERHPHFGKEKSEETKEKIRTTLKGRHLSQKHLNKIRTSMRNFRGENNHNWIKDRTKLKRYNDEAKDRRSSAYGAWRKIVYERDGFKCKISNMDCKGRIEAHHILGWSKFPDLRYEINNGITLCHFHHPKKRVDEERLATYFQSLI